MKGIIDNILSKLQLFSKAMMGPIFFLPVIGLILALSSILTNATLINEHSAVFSIGKMIGDTFWPLFGNLGLIFCIGITYGLAKDKKSEAALVAVMCFIMFLGANSSYLQLSGHVAAKINGEYYGTGQTELLGFTVVDMGIFLGLILGVTIAWVHNRLCNVELNGVFSVYGGAKLVLIAMTPIIMLYAVAFSYLWPAISQGLIALTGFMKSSGSLGVFVYGFFEKFLIPTGLHHFIWSPFQLTSIGGSIVQDGQTVSGSQAIFLAYMRDPSISPLMNEALRFSQQGMVTIFGLSGAALAFYHTAKPEKKMLAKAILIPAITTSILVGITEPIEFTFLFISPLLWVIHAVLTALSQVACNLFQVRPWGASGLVEFLAYNLPLPVSLTRWPLYVVIGLVQFAVYYLVFKTLVLKLNLKTPGREDDQDVKLYSKQDYRNRKNTLDEPSGIIIRALGGKENIISVDNCFTRLRVELKDMAQVDEAALKSTGAKGVVKNRREVQVIYGVTVGKVKNQVEKYLAAL
ncbi:PTS transporter subunit EIIC [Serratia marcescens]|uniref:PTS transporter subunit EIIC n=1 Tax=Serratia marcescens TaxID=615 RepID=UPI0015716ECF|nr:PTS transporter subunit EIIC [Serratia marcescens]NSM16515.1 PTS transporter subunit EIIC [Serratia marcescens]NSM96879.1 PTS transporter subunit EIIC [Serratia marcescens]CAF2574218.1 PTS system maltose-specific EIICB component [Serratia marcescens]CAF2662427.1 PTS system maltose-specific EIICB component [Serratia marcescens]CAH5205515.1 PTS system maltose-specific EIICB component [Serratia marcescens]